MMRGNRPVRKSVDAVDTSKSRRISICFFGSNEPWITAKSGSCPKLARGVELNSKIVGGGDVLTC